MTKILEPTQRNSLTEIMDLDTGRTISADSFIRREERLVIQDRNKMMHRYKADSKQPWLVCCLCGAAVQLVSYTDRSFYFRHMPEEEDRGCPINTKGKYSADQINAMKYNGAKESRDHMRIKEMLYNSIVADSRFESLPEVEKVWRGMDRKKWRKPDVQATWLNHKFAFEIQLSTTFLSVIVDRRDFYRTENGYLLWIFKDFDPNRTRRAEEDIFFNNNSNVFVVNQSTEQKSKADKRLTFECWYALPKATQGQIYDEWQNEYVCIDDLKFDQSNQHIYFVDYEAERKKLDASLTEEKKQHLRELFEQFWKEYGNEQSKPGTESWVHIRKTFKNINIELPEYYYISPFSGVVSIMLSAKYGQPIGYRYQKLIEVTNIAFTSYKHYLFIFGWALKVYSHDKIADAQDTKGTWRKRREEIRQAMITNDPKYERHRDYDLLIFFLLPELARQLEKHNQLDKPK
jgi:hypothetical protein